MWRLARLPQVWIFIVGLNNCPPATFKQIIPSPDPELHNGKELLLACLLQCRTTDQGPQIPQLQLSVKYIYKAGWLNLGQFSLASWCW